MLPPGGKASALLWTRAPFVSKCAALAALSKRKLHFTTFPRGQTWKTRWKELRLASLHQWVACFLGRRWRACSYRRALLDFPSGSVVKNLPANAGAGIPSLVWEDPACLRKAKPVCHSHWRSRALEARAQWWEKPLQREARTPQLEKSLHAVTKSQWNAKINNFFKKKNRSSIDNTDTSGQKPKNQLFQGIGEQLRLRQAWTWDLRPFAAVLAPGQTLSRAIKYKETVRD